jgi:hypothetical protein
MKKRECVRCGLKASRFRCVDCQRQIDWLVPEERKRLVAASKENTGQVKNEIHR